MVRKRWHIPALVALIGMACATRIHAQDATANIERAEATVAKIERLLDGIQTHRAASGGSTADAKWVNLFDGSSMDGWKRTEFRGGGSVHVEQSFHGGAPAIVVEAGSALSGLNWIRNAPSTNYEIAIEAAKIQGGDFMCGLTFPVGSAYATLILGGWGGLVVGISSIDDHDASENETTRPREFPPGRWFAIRMRVTPAKLEAWLDDKQIVDVKLVGKKISLRPGEISKSVPLGLSTYQTSSAFRAIKIRRLVEN